MDGFLTQSWERSILDFLKASKVPTTPSTATEEPSRDNTARGPKSGEAWWSSDFDISSITRLMGLIHDSEATSASVIPWICVALTPRRGFTSEPQNAIGRASSST